jgi:hypothetical protein
MIPFCLYKLHVILFLAYCLCLNEISLLEKWLSMRGKKEKKERINDQVLGRVFFCGSLFIFLWFNKTRSNGGSSLPVKHLRHTPIHYGYAIAMCGGLVGTIFGVLRCRPPNEKYLFCRLSVWRYIVRYVYIEWCFFYLFGYVFITIIVNWWAEKLMLCLDGNSEKLTITTCLK